MGRWLVPKHRDARLRRPGGRAGRPAEPRLLSGVPSGDTPRKPHRTRSAGDRDPDLERRVPGRAPAASSHGARAVRRGAGLPARAPAVRLPLLLLLQRGVLREPVSVAGRRLTVPRPPGAMGRGVALRARLWGHARARTRPRTGARPPLPGADPVRRATGAARRPLARAERAGARPLLRVPPRRVRRPVARLHGGARRGWSP